MKLTVLICTHNRLTLLRKAIGHLDQAGRPPGVACELLVVANGCSDGTLAWLRQRSVEADGGLPLRFSEERQLGKSFALNHGIDRLAGSDPNEHLIAFVDDDQRVDSGYLMAVADAVAAFPDRSLFCGRLLPDWDGREPAWVRDQGPYRIYPLPVPRFERGDEPLLMTHELGTPSGGNLIARFGVFERVGGYATELGPRGHDLEGGEDSEFVRRAQGHGEQLQYVPTITQYHWVDLERLKVTYLLRKSYLRTRASARLNEGGDRPAGRIPPLFLWRKLATYVGKGLWSVSWARTRFYLMRVAATLGEFGAYADGRNQSGLGGKQSKPIQ